jgi:competence protein ComGC
MKKFKLNNSERGISLVEIVMVIFIIGMVILLFGSLPNSISLIGTSTRESSAKEIALKKIESLRNLTYDNLAIGTSYITDSRLSSLPQGTGQVL